MRDDIEFKQWCDKNNIDIEYLDKNSLIELKNEYNSKK